MASAAALLEVGPDPLDAVAQALADGTRRKLLRLVRDDERAAGELAAAFPAISRPAVSQHLRVLRDAGLVAADPVSRNTYYRLAPEPLERLARQVEALAAAARRAGDLPRRPC